MKLVLAIAIFVGLILLANAVSAKEDNYKPITQVLIKLMDKNPEIKDMLGKSLEEARKMNYPASSGGVSKPLTIT